jgi:hypothetical protein
MGRTSILDGVDVGILQSRLASLQQAYLDLSSGARGETYSYTQGEGAKSVTYTRANLGDLTQAILLVQTQIDRVNGVRNHRRAPLRPYF